MTDTAAVTPPQSDAAPAGPLSHEAYGRLDPAEQGAWAQVPRSDGNGSEWVLRTSLSADAPSSTSQSLTRPDWAPESAWDAEKGLDLEKFGAWYRETVDPVLTRDAAERVRRNTLPANPDAYEIKVSPSLKLPDDAKPELDPAAPMWGKAKAWAHKNGLSQQAFSEAVDLVAAHDTITRTQVERARNAELGKLGAGAQVRMNAIEVFYKDLVGEDGARQAMARVWTAWDVQTHEKIIGAFTKQRGSTVTPRDLSISEDAYAAMDADEKFRFASQHDQSRFSGGQR